MSETPQLSADWLTAVAEYLRGRAKKIEAGARKDPEARARAAVLRDEAELLDLQCANTVHTGFRSSAGYNISARQYAEMKKDDDNDHVAQSEVDGTIVSTRWIGLTDPPGYMFITLASEDGGKNFTPHPAHGDPRTKKEAIVQHATIVKLVELGARRRDPAG